jgi:tetratricopeptide (TPR) repeat protein
MAFLFALALASRVASAQTPSDDPPSEVPTDEEMTEARGLFEAGRAAFARERYPQALEYFERSYEVLRVPELLYNVAQSAARSGDSERALRAFEQYLAMIPDGPEAEEVRARIAAIRAEQAPAVDTTIEPEAAPEPAPTPERMRAASSDMGPPAITIGASAAVAIAGAILTGVAASMNASIEAAADGATWADYRGDYESAPVLGGIGIAALALGLAGAGAAVGWLVVESAGDSVGVAVTPGGLVVSGTF